ncbi:MAG: triphosphoribosyl-dephospho-CoA synthase [Dongiaceae bacterium]
MPEAAVAGRVRRAYLAACRTELRALKPGNVHDHAAGHGMSVADFEASAAASAPAIAAPGLTVGERILEAIRRTRAVAGCNTNLGIVLLAAPLAAARLAEPTGPLQPAVERVLAGLDRADAAQAFAAITLAAPGGLGDSERHDVRAPALVGLREAMAEARGRDRIAEQYAGGYADVFGLGVPALEAALARWGDEAWAASAAYLAFLAAFPDSHVARKYGPEAAERLRRRVAPLAGALAAAPDPGRLSGALLTLDAALKAEGINPGTSADLTVASLLARRLCAGDGDA